MKTWYRIENATDAQEATVYIYNDIGMFGVTAEQFAQDLDAITAPVVNVRINSYGGEVFDGFAMFNAIRQHASTFVAHVDGIAASAATFPTLACDEVRMAKNAMLMIHNPWVFTLGEASDLRKEAEILDKLRDRIAEIYVDQSGQDFEQVVEWMDDETWFSAQEAIDNGFADSIADEDGDVPADPQNKRGQYWNSKHVPRERPSDRVKALGLKEFLPDRTGPATAGRKAATMPTSIKTPAAKTPGKPSGASTPAVPNPQNSDAEKAVWPDAADVKAGVSYGPTGSEYTGTREDPEPPTNATVKEIKDAFADDKEFAFARVDVEAPLVEHQAAYAQHLKQKNQTLREQLAKAKPGEPGRKPVDTADPEGAPDAEKPMEPARRTKLLALAGKSPR